MADAAAEYGMIVTTENYDYFTSDDFLEIFQRLDRPNVGLHNDTGNWLLLDEDPLEATRKVAPYTYHAHVRDYDLRDGVFTSVPLGRACSTSRRFSTNWCGSARRATDLSWRWRWISTAGGRRRRTRRCVSVRGTWRIGIAGLSSASGSRDLTVTELKKLRWGIIGCGQIAHDRVLPALELAKNGEVVALFDPDHERVARALLKAPGGDL